MNLAISNIAWKSEDRFAVYTLMQKAGFTGLEIAPALFLRASKQPYEQDIKYAQQACAELCDYGIKLVSMQALHFGENDMALFESSTSRQKLLDYTKQAIDFAGTLQIPNLVFGSPKLRVVPEGMSKNERDSIAFPFFRELGEHAESQNCVLSIEPNAKEYGTNFITKTEESIQLLQQLNHAGLGLNLDMGNLIANQTDSIILDDAASFIKHVHLSLPMLLPINEAHAPLLMAHYESLLPKINPNVYFSIEMRPSDLKSIAKAISQFANL